MSLKNSTAPRSPLSWIMAALLSIAASPLSAATRPVTTTNDSGPGSLRQALADAVSGDTISLADVRGIITLTSAQLTVNTDVKIIGPGANLLEVQRNTAPSSLNFRIFQINSGHTIAISGLTISHGYNPYSHGQANDLGGGIYNDRSTLFVDGCVFLSNLAAWGGGIYNDAGDGVANLTITNSTLTANSVSPFGGGAIANRALSGGNAVVKIANCTLSGNGASADGGAIYNFSAGGTASLTLINSTLSGNQHSTVSNNGGAVMIGSTILNGNSGFSAGETITNSGGGMVTSIGYNLSTDNGGGYLIASGDQVNTDPLLGPLFANGGPTRTHLPANRSPAIDKGRNLATDGNGNPILRDQRGLLRPVRYSALIAEPNGGDGSDIGAVELPAPRPQPLNIATRLRVQTGEKVLIAGMIATGSEPKKVLLRALGPSLAAAGVQDALPDPVLEVYYNGGQPLGANDDWTKGNQQPDIQATGLAPSSALESALIASLRPNDSFTVVVHGKNSATGIALVEAYDLDSAADSKLANISTRGFVETGDNVMIGGFIIGGNDPDHANMVFRAIGPSLSDFGISNPLQDPILAVYDRHGTPVGSNDNWKEGQPEIISTGLNPKDDREAALYLSLSPGNYTAIVSGKGGTTGVALVEGYNVP